LFFLNTSIFSFSSLPKYATEFLEMILMVTADHGPAVSGAHNTIVCARAGKDLVSCLASGLLTIVRINK
jgi:ATP citrate (pro-S)-lyase